MATPSTCRIVRHRHISVRLSRRAAAAPCIRPATIPGWPASERPRERLAAAGAGSLSAAELLAILIGHGRTGATAVDVARELLTRFGSLERIAGAGFRELVQIRGIGFAKAARIRAAFALLDRLGAEALRTATLLDDGRAVARRYAHLARRRRERCVVVLVDAKNQVVAERLISLGTLTSSLVGCREVLREAIREGAAGVILVHNHPSGDPEPSREDVRTTAQMRAACALVGIPLLDHVIVARKGFRSFSEYEGWSEK